jgi:hypothetical protein
LISVICHLNKMFILLIVKSLGDKLTLMEVSMLELISVMSY